MVRDYVLSDEVKDPNFMFGKKEIDSDYTAK